MDENNVFAAYYTLPADLVFNSLMQAAPKARCKIVETDSNYRIPRVFDGIVPGFENNELKYKVLLQGKATWTSPGRVVVAWIFYANDVSALAMSSYESGEYVWQRHMINSESRQLISKIDKELHKLIRPQSIPDVFLILGRLLVIHKAPTKEEDQRELEMLEKQATTAIEMVARCRTEGMDPQQYIEEAERIIDKIREIRSTRATVYDIDLHHARWGIK